MPRLLKNHAMPFQATTGVQSFNTYLESKNEEVWILQSVFHGWLIQTLVKCIIKGIFLLYNFILPKIYEYSPGSTTDIYAENWRGLWTLKPLNI